MSPAVFTPPTRTTQDSLVLSVSAVWTSYQRLVMLTMPSHIIHIMCLVPDGSVLGPLPFILHMVDQADITAQYMSLCTFVDDNQLYIDCQQDDVQLPAFSSVSATEQWMASSWLRLQRWQEQTDVDGHQVHCDKDPWLFCGHLAVPMSRHVRCNLCSWSSENKYIIKLINNKYVLCVTW